MNVMDRSSLAAADQDLTKAEARSALARKQRRRKIAIGVIVSVGLAIGLAALYVWWTTLCGDCGGPPLPPPTPG